MEPYSLISSARRLANPSANPTQEDLRLAVHASYYATFHTLSYSCADFLVGSTPDARASDEWAYAFRALDHGQVKRQCSQREIDRYHLGVQDFAEKFCELQEHRHDADYSSRARYTLERANSIINRAESAISDFNAVPEDERRRFIVYLLVRRRRM